MKKTTSTIPKLRTSHLTPFSAVFGEDPDQEFWEDVQGDVRGLGVRVTDLCLTTRHLTRDTYRPRSHGCSDLPSGGRLILIDVTQTSLVLYLSVYISTTRNPTQTMSSITMGDFDWVTEGDRTSKSTLQWMSLPRKDWWGRFQRRFHET